MCLLPTAEPPVSPQGLCVDILTLLASGSAPGPLDKANWTDFGDLRGYAKHCGGVVGRGSLSHLDPPGEEHIYGSSAFPMAFDYGKHMDGGPFMRTRPKCAVPARLTHAH